MSFIQYQNDERTDFEIVNNIKKPHYVTLSLNNRTVKGLIFITLFALTIPITFYYLIIDLGDYKHADNHTCLVDKTYRIPCGKPNITLENCIDIFCCFDNTTKLCYHYLPSKYYYHHQKDGGKYKSSKSQTPFGNAMTEEVDLSVIEIDENRMKIILHQQGLFPQSTTKSLTKKNYNIIKYENELCVDVYRTATEHILLTTSRGPLIVSDGYWEWSVHLTNEYLFGLGETLINLDDNSTLSKVIYRNEGDHTTLPIFMANKRGLYHGLIIRHSGPMEVTVLPSNLVIVKILAGTLLEFELSLGPRPSDVLNQQKSAMTDTNAPLNWILGAHICRRGHNQSLDEILSEFEKFLVDNAALMYETDCIHEKLWMLMFTMTDVQKSRLMKAVDKLRSKGTKFLLVLPPQVPHNVMNITKGAIYQTVEGQLYTGKYFDFDVVYPNFNHPGIHTFTANILSVMQDMLNGLPDGLMLVDNWPADESFEMVSGAPFPYTSKYLLEAMSHNLPWNVTTAENLLHIVNHNSYGHQQYRRMKNESSLSDLFVVSSSNDVDYFGPLMVQNGGASWADLRKAVKTVLSSGLFSSRLLSVPACGSTTHFDPADDEAACLRWYLVAATMPLLSVYSAEPRRDPGSLHSKFVTQATLFALHWRRSLIPHFRTILQGGKDPLVRPMFYDFSDDNTTLALDEQYMIGDQLLIAHPFLPNQSLLSVYLPGQARAWYEYWDGRQYGVEGGGKWISVDIVETDLVVFVAGGAIIPHVKERELELLVALLCANNICAAKGKLLLDGGDITITFVSNDKILAIDGITNDAKIAMKCEETKPFVLKKISLLNITKTVHIVKASLCDCNQTLSYWY